VTTTTTDVRIWSVRTYHGVREDTYNLRWSVAGRTFCKTYKLKSEAVKHKTELSEVARHGVPFDIYAGLPITVVAQQIAETTWYDHAVAFVDMKWPTLQPGSRRCLATALATVTLAMTSQQRRRPDPEVCIKALLNWSFNRTARTAGDPPVKFAEAIAWVRTHSLKVGALNNPQTLRSAFNATLIAPDGKIYAAITHRNRLKVLSGAIRYAIELGLLERNPLERISTPPCHTLRRSLTGASS